MQKVKGCVNLVTYLRVSLLKFPQVSGNLSKRGKMDLALKKKSGKETAAVESTESEDGDGEEDDLFGVSGGGRPPFTSTQASIAYTYSAPRIQYTVTTKLLDCCNIW